MNHPQVDNVVYVNFRSGRKTPPPPPTPVPKTPSPATAGQRLRAFVHGRTDSGRIGRGRDYARKGAVADLEFRGNAIHAQVSGSQNYPFEVYLSFPRLSAEDQTAVAQAISSLPQGLQDFQAGNLSGELIDLLLAPEAQMLRLSCSCPDPAEVCKHLVAVADIAEGRIDRDPMVLLALRGLNQLQVQESIHMLTTMAATARAETPDLPNPASSEEFWQGGALPPLPDIQPASVLEESDMALLHQAMRMISYTAIDELAAISDLEDIYYHLMNQERP